MTKLFAFLFYGYYSSLGCQQICGYGTKNDVSGVYYPKITGSTDELNMTDTDTTNGNGAASPSEDQIIAGIGSDIKTVNFWGLESCWGDESEWLSNLYVMEASRPSTITTPDITNYVADYLNEYSNIIVTKPTGVDVTYTSKEQFLADYPNPASRFLSISDKNSNIIRIIDIDKTANVNGYIKKMLFGAHADIIAKVYNDNTGADIGFTDSNIINIISLNRFMRRSNYADGPSGGVGCIESYYGTGYDDSILGARLLYDGDESNVHIVDDATEEL